MATAFQESAFQVSAFQIDVVVTPPGDVVPPGSASVAPRPPASGRAEIEPALVGEGKTDDLC